MVVETIGVHNKVYVDSAGFVHDEGPFSNAAIVGNMEFATNVLLRDRILVLMALVSNQTSP